MRTGRKRKLSKSWPKQGDASDFSTEESGEEECECGESFKGIFYYLHVASCRSCTGNYSLEDAKVIALESKETTDRDRQLMQLFEDGFRRQVDNFAQDRKQEELQKQVVERQEQRRRIEEAYSNGIEFQKKCYRLREAKSGKSSLEEEEGAAEEEAALRDYVKDISPM